MQSTSLAWSTQTCLAVNTCTLGDIYIFMLMQRESQSAGLPKGVSRDETRLCSPAAQCAARDYPVVPRLLGGPLDVEFMQGWREMGPEQRETIRNI